MRRPGRWTGAAERSGPGAPETEAAAAVIVVGVRCPTESGQKQSASEQHERNGSGLTGDEKKTAGSGSAEEN